MIGQQLEGNIGRIQPDRDRARGRPGRDVHRGAGAWRTRCRTRSTRRGRSPSPRRPGFPWSWLRSAALIIVIGLGLIATTVLSGLASVAAITFRSPPSVPPCAVSLVLNFGLFWLALPARHRERRSRWRQLWLGAAISAAHLAGTAGHRQHFVSRQLAHASPLYGTFALVTRPDRLALPAGPAHLVRRRDQRGPGLPAVAAKLGPAAVYGTRPPCVPAIRREAQRPIRHRGGGRR